MELITYYNSLIAKIITKIGIFQTSKLKPYENEANDLGVRLEQHLLKQGLISEEQLVQVRVQYLKRRNQNIDAITYDDNLILSISEDFFKQHKFFPLKREIVNDKFRYVVATHDVYSEETHRAIKNLFGEDVEICYASFNKVQSVFNLVHSKSKLQEAYSEYTSNVKTTTETNLDDQSVESAPIVRMVENILKEAIASKVSDVHIEPYEDFVRVRYRIDGILYESTTFSLSMYVPMITRLKIISGLNITEKRIPQDGRFSLTINGDNYDFRLSTLPMVHGEKVVIRVLDTSAFNFNLSELGFSEESIELITPVLKTPHGIILLTGPTGCGKSTTLYSFIRELNNKETNIVSVEDPVEYSISGVNQVQVNSKVNLTFASSLRSILRQDPNVIMIGEIRDEETAQIAIRSAITGHLVLSTLHTNDALGSIIRLIDMGVERYLVTDALKMVISQRLVRRLCPECKKEHLTTPQEMKILGIKEPCKVYEPCGCTACHNTGYKGRIGIHEILLMDNNIKDMVARHEPQEKIQEYLNNQKDYRTLESSLKELIFKGVTSVEEFNVVKIEK